MNDLHFFEKREHFYHTSHHIKVLLRKLQQADSVEEVREIELQIHSSIDNICEIKADDITEFNMYREMLISRLIKWGFTDGKA